MLKNRLAAKASRQSSTKTALFVSIAIMRGTELMWNTLRTIFKKYNRGTPYYII
jgi:hypothetical protein